MITSTQKNESCFGKILGAVTGLDNISRVLLGMIQTCDPSLSFSEAKDLAASIVDDGSVTKNGITYVFALDGENAIIGLTIE